MKYLKAKPIADFKAVFNPYTRELIILYGSTITHHYFEDIEERTYAEYGEDKPQYLHIQLDYDENFQLLFYPRVNESESLNESIGTYWYPTRVRKSKRIKIAQNDVQWNECLLNHLKLERTEFTKEYFKLNYSYEY